jgi:phenol/toluene 2-monooxygenase (NADH) P2/A2
MPTQVTRPLVGVEIMAGEECDAIVEAALEFNPETKVQPFPSFVRLDVPNRLVLRRERVEEFLGRDWDTRDLNQVVSAYHGYFSTWDRDKVVLSWDPNDTGESVG